MRKIKDLSHTVSDCDKELNATNTWEIFQSPNYAYNVPPLMNCTWTINVPDASNLAMVLDDRQV